MSDIDITIIGAGVVGSAIAHALSVSGKYSVCLLDKNLRSENQSTRNSGVIHAGVYYPKDVSPLKAELCVKGNSMLYEFCKEHNIAHAKTGKVIVATTRNDVEYLDDVLRISKENRVPGIRKISKKELKVLEPNIEGIEALLVPTSGIIDPVILTRKLQHLATNNNAIILDKQTIKYISALSEGFEIFANEKFTTSILINSAGLYSDDIARMVDPQSPYEIIPVRGEAAKYYSHSNPQTKVSMNIYPAPYGYYNDTGEKADVNFAEYKKLLQEKKITRTVGIHLTPTFDIENTSDNYSLGNTITIGPAKSVGNGKEDYGTGLRPETYYYKNIKHFLPEIEEKNISLHQAGIMAVLKGHTDWIIEPSKKHPKMINLIGIDSPGLTAAIAVGEYIKEIVEQI